MKPRPRYLSKTPGGNEETILRHACKTTTVVFGKFLEILAVLESDLIRNGLTVTMSRETVYFGRVTRTMNDWGGCLPF